MHHANVYMAQPELGTVGFDAGERWASFAPGRPPTTFPDGVARRLPHGARLTLEIHYTPDGVPRDDRTVIGLRFARTPPRREARSIPLGTLNFAIPPGAPAHEVTATYTLKGNGQTFEEMMFGFVELVYDEDVGPANLRALRAADLQSLPTDRGFSSWAELGAWPRQFQEHRPSR